MKNTLAFLFAFALAQHCWAQTPQYELKGKVTDRNDGETVVGATVIVVGTGSGAFTDEDGNYSIKLKTIPDMVVCELGGFEVDTVENITEAWPSGESTYQLDIIITPITRVPLQYFYPAPIYIIEYISRMDRVSVQQTQRGDLSSIEQGLNLVPGVKFESRGPGGSRRLAIRGGFLRSPFGVRDVKAYLDDAPLTSPDGSTALELIDATTIGAVDVFKGPCASEYGPVSNGVVKFGSLAYNKIGNSGGLISQMIGSYGYLRTAAQLNWDNMLGLTYVRQRYSGYRAQESNQKDFLQMNFAHHFENYDPQGPYRGHFLEANLMLYQGAWDLPGSLDSLAAAQDPRQALPTSVALDAHVERRHLRVALSDNWTIAPKTSLLTAAYLHLSDKTNPFGTSAFNQGYKIESSQGFGGRSVWTYAGRGWKERIGVEYQAEWLDFKQFDNVLGQAGALNTRSKTLSTQAHAFTELGYQDGKNAYLGQVSLSKVAYNQSEAWSSVEPIPVGKTRLQPQLAGTLSWGYHTTSRYRRSFFLRAASAYSPPALWEMTDSLGQLRTDLKPETGINVEWRGRSSFLHEKIFSELNVYHHNVFNTIVPQTLSSGRTIYENQGRTTQIGVEGVASMHKWRPDYDRPLIRTYGVVLSGAYQHYYFNDYSLDGVSYAGKRIPGVPLYTLNLQGDIEFRSYTQLQLTAQVVGRTYLNTANTVWQSDYPLLHFKASQSIAAVPRVLGSERLDAKASVNLFAGLNNILNTRYTNFPQLNAAAGRYYNPAPGINWFAGADFKF